MQFIAVGVAKITKMPPPKQQPSKPGGKERELHGVRRERAKQRPSRGRGSSRQSVLMRQLKRRSQLRRRLLAKEVGAHYLDWSQYQIIRTVKG